MNGMDSAALDAHITGNYGEDQLAGDMMSDTQYDRLLEFVGTLNNPAIEMITPLARWSAANGGNTSGCDGCEIDYDPEVFEAAGITAEVNQLEPDGSVALTYCAQCVDNIKNDPQDIGFGSDKS
jgi:hypothetical protein